MSHKLFVVLFLSLIVFSCEGQKLNSDNLFGNWQVIKNAKSPMIYQEIFIDKEHIYFWDENVGYIPKGDYFIDKESLFISHLGSEFENLGIIQMSTNNMFSIADGKHIVFYKRIPEGEEVLQKLIEQKITQETYSRNFFKRLESFKKNGL